MIWTTVETARRCRRQDAYNTYRIGVVVHFPLMLSLTNSVKGLYFGGPPVLSASPWTVSRCSTTSFDPKKVGLVVLVTVRTTCLHGWYSSQRYEVLRRYSKRLLLSFPSRQNKKHEAFI